jgi:acyl carrier protein
VAGVFADGRVAIHMEGRCNPLEQEPDREPAGLSAIRLRCPNPYPADLFYQGLDLRGIGLGPRFRWHDELWLGFGEALGRLRPSTGHDDTELNDSPGQLDACFQLISVLLPEDGCAWIPLSLGGCRFHRASLRGATWCHAVVRRVADPPHADLRLLDQGGRPLLTLWDVLLRPVTSSQLRPIAQSIPGDRDRLEAAATPLADLAGSLSLDEARASLNRLLHDEARAVLETDQPIKPTSSLFELGMDSLMALELRDRLQVRLALRLPATLVFDYPSVEQLTGVLLDELGRHHPQPLPDLNAPERLSEEELERLLLRKVRELGGKGPS